MFTITLTRQQLYELSYGGPEATAHFIEGLPEEPADQEQVLGERQQRVIDAQHERNERQAAQLRCVREKLERQACLNYQLTRRLRELQAEVGRHEVGGVRRAARLNPPPKAEKPDALAKRYKVVRVKRRDPARPLISRLQARREQVLRFMGDFRVPFHNDATERDLRMVKLRQKIGGCFRTPEGAVAFCRIRSYLSTAREQGHLVLAALERAFRGQPIASNGLPRPE